MRRGERDARSSVFWGSLDPATRPSLSPKRPRIERVASEVGRITTCAGTPIGGKAPDRHTHDLKNPAGTVGSIYGYRLRDVPTIMPAAFAAVIYVKDQPNMPKVAETKQRPSKEAPAGKEADTSPPPRRHLDLPESTQPPRVYWRYVFALALLHGLACLAFIPWLFSWTGVIVAIGGHFLFGMMGITVGYHRLLTHQGFVCPKWFEHTLAILGICTLQDSPARWVAIHRLHHKYSDEQPDPHSPLVNFFWGHMGWIFVENRDHNTASHFERYVRDLLRDPFYLALERKSIWLGIYILHGLMLSFAGFLGGWIATGTLMGGVQLGLSVMVWGVFVRTVFVMHGTWAVNSATHTWGYRNYATTDNSRNSFLVALVSHGEGWHNNHHHDQRAASHGHRWWEFDMSWRIIRGLEMIGLAKDVVRPRCWKQRAVAGT